MSSKNDHETLFRNLSDFLSGTLTVSVNKFPFAKIDGEAKTLDLDMKGLENSGLRLDELFQSGDSKKNDFLETLRLSGGIAKNLHEQGWKLRVFEGDESLVALGQGVSSLTGFIWVNPLKLSKIRKLI